ncbi:MAG: gliding motility-associated C-terminal domain-containing protein [Flavobacteriales bacterium]|nr:gliding motility-associated C-terminal domain-containing protein [Flavobacteriales bacterium]
MINKTIKSLSVGLVLLLLFALPAVGQQFSISAGSVNTCSGILEDTGGPSGQYSNNENFTVVICADNPGDAISLTWVVFTLSPTGPNPPDRIQIWDGNSTAATFLGEYSGTSLQGLITSATSFNTTGCLTVRFISNGNGTGNFAASITCYTPCERPTAVGTMSEGSPARICVGEVLDFDGNGSYAAQNFYVASYTWDFDDGETFNGPVTSHSFAEPGEYVVQLFLLDDNDCASANLVDLQVLVSTTPSFAGTVESIQTCIGATVDLNAVVTPVTWTGIPEANFGDGVYLPDDLGLPFTSELNFTQFEPGQMLTNVADVLSICVSLEHSFMGDLVLSVTCPGGQTIILHQQGGGGTYFGDANDGDSNADPVAGECWDYCWSPTATLGIMEDCAQFGPTPNTMPSSQGTALSPGTYSSVQPFTNLLGCPLNGTWTFTSTDLWGADNGFLCSWSLNLNPAIIPDVTQFTPDPGTSTLDSASWTGDFLVSDPTNPLSAQATPNVPGDFDYTFMVTDDFGCSYDTTITITVPPLIELDAGPELALCSDPVPMAGMITANGPPSNCDWTLTLYEAFGDSWNGGASLAVTIDGVTTNYTVPSGPEELSFTLNVSTGSTIQLTFTAGTTWNNENSFTLFNELGGTVYASPDGPPTGVAYNDVIVCGGGTTPVTFEWSPTDGLTDPSDPTTDVYVTEPTWFYLTVYPAGNPECAVMDSVLVVPDPSIDAGLANAITLCASDPIIQLTDSLGGTPDAGGVWTSGIGTVVPNTFDPATGLTDVYLYTVTSIAGCVATSTLDITVIPSDDPTCCGVVDAGEPAFSCDLTIALSATPGNTGVGNWVGPTGAVFGNATDPITTVTMPVGNGGTHRFYWEENDGAFCNLKDSVDMTFTDAYVFTPTLTDALCFGYCDGIAEVDVVGGNSVGGLNFAWSNGQQGIDLNTIEDLCMGDYTLTVADDNGCEGSVTVNIAEPILLEIDSLAHQPVTCSGDCDGVLEVYDPEAVEYSFDDGASWSTSSQRVDVCEGFHAIRIKDAIGCFGSGNIVVSGPPPVIANFGWGPNPANVNAPTITFGNLSANAERYFWNIDEQFSSTETNTAFTFSNKEPGMYEACLIAYNFNDCPDTACQMVVIDDVLFTYVPNSFTPDGDAVNDTWGMSMNIPVITDFELMVFDRWGQLVYNTLDPYKPWLGSYQNGGEILKSDVYAYRILYGVRNTEARKEIVGHVTLIK